MQQVPVVAPPRALGLEQRPTMAEMASLCFRLPLWLRTGRGWMVGGSYTQAAGFGAGALLDDEPFGEKIDPSPVIRDGDQMQSLLQQLRESPSTAESARKLINQPAINWPDAKQLFDRAGWWRRQQPETILSSRKDFRKMASSPRRSLPPLFIMQGKRLTTANQDRFQIKRARSSSRGTASVQRAFCAQWFLISMCSPQQPTRRRVGPSARSRVSRTSSRNLPGALQASNDRKERRSQAGGPGRVERGFFAIRRREIQKAASSRNSRGSCAGSRLGKTMGIASSVSSSGRKRIAASQGPRWPLPHLALRQCDLPSR